jgi:hypothetical protein
MCHPKVRMKKKRIICMQDHQQGQHPAPLFSKFTQKVAGDSRKKRSSQLLPACHDCLSLAKRRPGGLQVPCGCKVTLDKEKKKQGLWEVKKRKGFRWPRANRPLTHTHDAVCDKGSMTLLWALGQRTELPVLRSRSSPNRRRSIRC